MALWREWSVGIAAGVTTITFRHYLELDGHLVMTTAVRMNAQVKIGHETSDMMELDGYLSSQWTDNIVAQIRENLRLNTENPDYSVAQVRAATEPILGAEDTPVQIL